MTETILISYQKLFLKGDHFGRLNNNLYNLQKSREKFERVAKCKESPVQSCGPKLPSTCNHSSVPIRKHKYSYFYLAFFLINMLTGIVSTPTTSEKYKVGVDLK